MSPRIVRPLLDWLAFPRNAALLNGIGLVLGVVGFVFTLLGLYLALRQLKAIKSETEATRAAIQSVQLKVASFDAAQECQIARNLITSIRNHLQAQSWTDVLQSYEELIQSFLRLSHSNAATADADRQLLIKMTRDMAGMCEGIRKKQLIEGQKAILRGQDQALRDFTDITTKITFAVAKDLQQ